MKNFALVSLLMLSMTVQAQEKLPEAVNLAQAAYLNCDGTTVLKHVKTALLEGRNHPLIVNNTMGLLSAAKKNGCLKKAKPDFSLPSEVNYLEIEVARKYRTDSGKVTFAVNGTIGVKSGSDLEQFQVVRYPDQIMLDMKAGVGEMDLEEEHEGMGYWFGGAQNIKPTEEGLYLINVKLKGQPMVQAYALLTEMNSSASPVVLSPAVHSALTTSTPTLAWKAFQSPERRADEKIRVTTSVRRELDEGDDVVWARLKDEKATSFTVGDRAAAKHYQGADELTPQKYQMQVSYKEVESFGSIGIRRASTTRVPFSVK